jgi:hydroxymethylglutaryl-CoA reductase
VSQPSHTVKAFYKLSLAERRQCLAAYLNESAAELNGLLDRGGIDAATADKLVENVLGTYALPFGVARHFVVNDVERWVPMVVEEPSVIAAASNAAQRVRQGGGFRAAFRESLMTAQIQLHGVAEPGHARERILAQAPALLRLAEQAVPGLMSRGGGPKSLEVRDLGEGFVVVHLLVDCLDAMGANLVNTIAEAIGPSIAALGGGVLGLRILTNLCDHRRVLVECSLPCQALVKRKLGTAPGTDAAPDDAAAQDEGARIAEAIENASRFAELDPYRAATHNKGIMNGIDSVVIATGNDYRAVEAGAHAYAARSGTYRPLATWRRRNTQLCGSMELPLSLGIVGGTLRAHPTAQFALRLLRVGSANELAEVAAAAGLASNLSALRALGTDGIQKGHMALHARSVATLAGARGDEVEQVAAAFTPGEPVNVDNARAKLERLRTNGEGR